MSTLNESTHAAQDDTGRTGNEAAPVAAEAVPDPAIGILAIRMLSIGSIRPNGYNPNVMGPEDKADYAAEVGRLRRLPRPLVVRPAEDGFVLIDGEHGL